MSLGKHAAEYRQHNDAAAERLGHDERPARIARARERALDELRALGRLTKNPQSRFVRILDVAAQLVDAERP